MDRLNNQNLIVFDTLPSVDELKKIILGFANTFGGYIIFKEEPTFISQLRVWCESKSIGIQYTNYNRYFYILVDLKLDLVKSDMGKFYFKIGDKLIEGKHNLIGINYSIYTSIRGTDLLPVEQTLIEDIFAHVSNNPVSQLYFPDLEYRESFITLLHTSSVEERHQSAKVLISKLWKRHEKDTIFMNLLESLDSYEQGAHYFYKSQRDHVIHQALVYLLGIYVCKLIGRLDWLDYDAKFIWRLAATTHDVAYPFQITSEAINLLVKDIYTTSNSSETPLFITTINKDFIDAKLKTVDMPISKLIENKIHYNILEILSKELKSGTPWCKYTPFYDHGILSGIFMIKIIDELYHKNRTKPGYDINNIRNEIAPAAVAIMVHNRRWKDADKFNRISHTNQIAFLLIISDMLQEWDRSSPSKMTIPPSGIKLNYESSTKTLWADIIYDEETILELNTEINEKLTFSDDLRVKFRKL